MVPDQTANAKVEAMWRENTIFTAAIIMIALIAGLLFASMILRPVRLLSGAAKSLGRGDLSARVPSGRCDELGQLGETFDLVGSESSTRLKTDDEKTFVCTYEVASLPLETKMHISPEFMDSKILNSRWISDLTEDGFVALPSGMSRILAGEGYVTLTRQTATIERNFTLGRTRQWERPPIY